MNAIILKSVLTCPYCGFAKRERMPTDACQFYYECNHCNALPGDCCVFRSLGSMMSAYSATAWMLRGGLTTTRAIARRQEFYF